MKTTLITGAHFATPPDPIPAGYTCLPHANGYIVGKVFGSVGEGEAVPINGHFINEISLDLGVDGIVNWAVCDG